MDKMGNERGIKDLGKRTGLPLPGDGEGFFTSDGQGGLMKFDLEAELANMEQEDDTENDIEVQYDGAYVVKKNKQ